MAKLYFKHGTLNSSKSANLLMTAHNYETQGKRIIILKPKVDTRSTPNMVESRVGISHECIDVSKEDDLYNIVLLNIASNSSPLHAVLVEESQFTTKQQVKQLDRVAHILKIPVLAYGLKNTYIEGQLFEGSEALIFYADKVEEIKNVCMYCDRKSTQNLRVFKGKPIYSGEPISVGDVKESDDYYVSVCNYHYYNPKL